MVDTCNDYYWPCWKAQTLGAVLRLQMPQGCTLGSATSGMLSRLLEAAVDRYSIAIRSSQVEGSGRLLEEANGVCCM